MLGLGCPVAVNSTYVALTCERGSMRSASCHTPPARPRLWIHRGCDCGCAAVAVALRSAVAGRYAYHSCGALGTPVEESREVVARPPGVVGGKGWHVAERAVSQNSREVLRQFRRRDAAGKVGLHRDARDDVAIVGSAGDGEGTCRGCGDKEAAPPQQPAHEFRTSVSSTARTDGSIEGTTSGSANGSRGCGSPVNGIRGCGCPAEFARGCGSHAAGWCGSPAARGRVFCNIAARC